VAAAIEYLTLFPHAQAHDLEGVFRLLPFDGEGGAGLQIGPGGVAPVHGWVVGCAGLFEETFLNNSKNRRTQELVLLMQQLQIDEADDLVGVTIQIEIKYRVTDSGARFPSIIARTPLPPPTLEPSIPSEETH
jgi:hypothetical protein